MKRAVAIRHVPFEDLGSFADVLCSEGYAVTYIEAGFDALDNPDARHADLLFILGGPIGANDDREFPFLKHELHVIEHRLETDRPILAICLGAQLLARALGARVFQAPRKEIGWSPLTLTRDGNRSPLRYLAAEKTSVLHWHGDTFDLPRNAVRLASTPACENQAFGWSHHALGLQFHPEVTSKGLERWFIGHTCEIQATPGVSVAGLRSDTARFAPALEIQGPTFFRAWLDRLHD